MKELKIQEIENGFTIWENWGIRECRETFFPTWKDVVKYLEDWTP